VFVLLKILRREVGSYVGTPYLWFVSDNQKWEIKPFGAGYTVQKVSAPMLFIAISTIVS
jgi:hypothetical protein